MKITREKYNALVNEICCETCAKEKYCLIKEILFHSVQDPRLIIQLKCIEKFKWEESEKEGKDIGWSEAHMRWVTNGYAKKFADNYIEDITFKTLYQKIME